MRVLKTALEEVENAYVPVEIIMLIAILQEQMKPEDAIVCAYLIGKKETTTRGSHEDRRRID